GNHLGCGCATAHHGEAFTVFDASQYVGTVIAQFTGSYFRHESSIAKLLSIALPVMALPGRGRDVGGCSTERLAASIAPDGWISSGRVAAVGEGGTCPPAGSAGATPDVRADHPGRGHVGGRNAQAGRCDSVGDGVPRRDRPSGAARPPRIRWWYSHGGYAGGSRTPVASGRLRAVRRHDRCEWCWPYRGA